MLDLPSEDRTLSPHTGWTRGHWGVLLAHLTGDTERLAVLGPRLEEFLGSYAATFDAGGAPLHQGRSRTYRWAVLAPVALGELIGRTPCAPGSPGAPCRRACGTSSTAGRRTRGS